MTIAAGPTDVAAAPAGDRAAVAGTPILVAEDLHKTYRLGRIDVPVLKGASMEVREGQWTAILGASGSGKSTLLHLLGDLDRPDRPAKDGRGGGHVRFRDRRIDEQSLAARNRYRNRSVGFVFQFYHLLPELTVLENACLPALVGVGRLGWSRKRREVRDRAASLLEQFGLGHRLRHRPRELSGGERQRTAIARALVNEPEVLLADEPTGNLDVHTGGGILDLLADLHRGGLTIVMVTHDESIAERADRMVHLVDGRVARAAATP